MTHTLITALQNPALYDHPVTALTLVETHISWVILTGPFAYKIKKPVNLGFLDFSTLPLRQQYCEAELRLNKRLAPEYYLSVVAITGTASAPRWQGEGPAIEYAVKMRQFPQAMELDRIAKSGQLRRVHLEQLAADVADFHATLPKAEASMTYGDPDAVWQPIAENFQQLQPCCQSVTSREQLASLHDWCVASHAELLALLQQRKSTGCIRECHGDMHLANMFLAQERVVVFDCIEFNPALRWIDVISEIAFLTMDLRDRRHPELARCFLDRYLQHSGDYAGLALLNYYQVYRAMVRAKVACIRLQQADLNATESKQLAVETQDYLALGEHFTRTTTPTLFITHGLSGSGKTFFTDALIAAFDVVRVRSDVERKRLVGLSATAKTDSGVDSGLYAAEMGARTYAQLASAANDILHSGYHALVDATFLQQAQRAQFAQLAHELNVPMVILHFTATPETLQRRIQSRQRNACDASEADLPVLQRQRERVEPLTTAEQVNTIEIDTETTNASEKLLATVQQAIYAMADYKEMDHIRPYIIR